MVDSDLNCRSHGICRPNAYSTVVLEHGVDDVRRGLESLIERNIDPVLGEAENETILHVQILTGKEPNSVESGPDTVNSEVAKNHDVGLRIGLDYDSVSAAHKHGSDLASAAVNGDGFGDGDCAEPAWIQSVNLSARGGLRDGAGESLTGSCAAARVGIVSHTRYPGAAGLCLQHRRPKCDDRQQSYYVDFPHFVFALSLIDKAS